MGDQLRSEMPQTELLLYQIREILAKSVSQPGAAGSGYPHNTTGFQVQIVIIAAVNTQYTGPDIIVPDGMPLLVKAAPTNVPGGFIYVGETAAAALNVNSRWPLVPNEFLSLKVQNAKSVHISGTNVNDVVLFICEKAAT